MTPASDPNVIHQLETIPRDDPQLSSKAWRALLGSDSFEDFAVAFDFAMEEGLYSTPFAGHLRGDDRPDTMQEYWTNPIDGTQMAWIPPGRFVCGAEPTRTIHCDGFFLARDPITNAQFHKFISETGYSDSNTDFGPLLHHWGSQPTYGFKAMDATGQEIEDQVQAADQAAAEQAIREMGYFPVSVWLDEPPECPEQRLDHPVVYVSFIDAVAYCDWAGLSLPSEWMWEKAARGINGRLYPWGDSAPFYRSWRGTESDHLANVSASSTVPIGQFREVRSPYGCDDLIGNVSEWCWREDLDDRARAVSIPESSLPTSETEVTVRGSCYKRRTSSLMVASHRRMLTANRRNDWVGFRPAFVPRWRS